MVSPSIDPHALVLLDDSNFFFNVEPPRFLNRSNSLLIARLYSTIEFFCEIYAVPYPTVTWYKVIERKEKQNHNAKDETNEGEDLQLLSSNSQQ